MCLDPEMLNEPAADHRDPDEGCRCLCHRGWDGAYCLSCVNSHGYPEEGECARDCECVSCRNLWIDPEDMEKEEIA